MSGQNNIIERSVRGDETAFRELVESYSDFAFSLAFRIISNEEEARDIVQESFVSVWKQIGRFDPRKRFSNWLYRIVVNRCYDFLRKESKVRWIRPDNEDWELSGLLNEEHPGKILDNKELAWIISTLTQKLSPKQKLAFVLCELEDRSHAEVSELTGMPKSSVKSNLNHARRKIGEMIEKYL